MSVYKVREWAENVKKVQGDERLKRFGRCFTNYYAHRWCLAYSAYLRGRLDEDAAQNGVIFDALVGDEITRKIWCRNMRTLLLLEPIEAWHSVMRGD